MPVYELFALIRADLSREKIVAVLRRTGNTVLKGNGVLTDLKSYGEQPLAYRINSPDGYHYEVGMLLAHLVGCLHTCLQQAHMISMYFAANPAVLTKLNYDLRIDERVLRYKVFKQRSVPAYPSPYYIGKVLRDSHYLSMNISRSPIIGNVPNAAYKLLRKQMETDRDVVPGLYGFRAAKASETLQNICLLPPQRHSAAPVLPPAPWGAQTSRLTPPPSFAAGSGQVPQPPWCVDRVVVHRGVRVLCMFVGVRAVDDHTVIPV